VKATAATAAAVTFGLPVFERQADASQGGPLVFVIVDDLASFTDIDQWLIPRSDGRKSAPNPWMSGFARKNTNFVNAHTASPACGSSRPAMLWGVPPHVSGIMTHAQAGDWAASPALQGRSIIGRLRDAGWNTHGFGKIFHSEQIDGMPDCWTSFTPHVSDNDWHDKFGNGFAPGFGQIGPHGPTYWAGPDQLPDHAMVGSAIRAMRSGGPGDAFFVGISKPHVGLEIPQRFHNAIDPDEIVLPAVGPTLTGDALAFQQGAFGPDMQGIVDTGQQRQLIASYLAAVKFADFQFMRIMTSLPPNSTVILTSDHGFALGERMAFSKQTLWSQSTKIPLVVSGPARKVWTATSALDVHETIADICGLGSSGGDSLRAIAGRPYDDSRAVLTSYEGPARVGSPVGHAVQQGGHHYIAYGDGSHELHWTFSGAEMEMLDMAEWPGKVAVIEECRTRLPGGTS